ncbi:MAG: isoprenylcysteine carboxylmethyltransferase family protein [Kordiimonadaceae bacterium]|nr:isoprenylcysteine carboxylmethyltransferase family protein [Kordiimonadaceae bacterium]
MISVETLALYGPALLIAGAIIWGAARMIYLWRAQGVSVLAVSGRNRTATDYCLAATAIILDAYLCLRPFYPEIDTFVFTTTPGLPGTGLILMVVGVTVAIICQLGMGSAWRIGVPEERETSQSLVTTGLHAYSRNPIYVGIMLFIIGSAFIAPGPITTLSTIATWLFLQPLVKGEEAFMADAFGEEYQIYCTCVRRWL